MNLNLTDLTVREIAGPLSKICRYSGNTKRFYSVAEHSVLMAQKAPPDIKLQCLLHDASEIVVGDIPAPVKKLAPAIVRLEDVVLEQICARYGVDMPLDERVHMLDRRIRRDEIAQAVGRRLFTWPDDDELEPLGVRLNFWSPDDASRHWLDLFWKLMGERQVREVA